MSLITPINQKMICLGQLGLIVQHFPTVGACVAAGVEVGLETAAVECVRADYGAHGGGVFGWVVPLGGSGEGKFREAD